MTKMIEHIIKKSDAELIRKLSSEHGHGECLLWDTTVKIDDDHVLDISIYGSIEGNTPWVDAVLFQRDASGNGFVEIGSMDVGDAETALGEFHLGDLNNSGMSVTVVVKEAEE